MALATWWRGDTLPALVPVPGFHVEASRNVPFIARVTGLAREQVQQRLDGNHQPHIAYIDEEQVGYVWLARQSAEIGELGLRFSLPPEDLYLWDFARLPAWQGYGIYPLLLQSILKQQLLPVERVWIIYAAENTPSGAGMHKAGLTPVGQLSFRVDGGVGLLPIGSPQCVQAGAALLGVPIIEHVLAPCWSCGSATQAAFMGVGAVGCWPPAQVGEALCTCAVQLKPGKISPVGQIALISAGQTR